MCICLLVGCIGYASVEVHSLGRAFCLLLMCCTCGGLAYFVGVGDFLVLTWTVQVYCHRSCFGVVFLMAGTWVSRHICLRRLLVMRFIVAYFFLCLCDVVIVCCVFTPVSEFIYVFFNCIVQFWPLLLLICNFILSQFGCLQMIP